MQYDHTQRGMLHYLLLAVVASVLWLAWLVRNDTIALAVVMAVAVVCFICAFFFRDLTVQDEGDCLAVRFGPLPLFGKRIRYSEITDVAPGRSSLLDGWGIHYLPGRGWTYNVWGFDCVVLHLGKKVIRIGSDDVDNLVDFIKAKIGGSRPS